VLRPEIADFSLHFDAVIVSTRADGASDWPARDLPAIESRLVPVAVVEAAS
jgi:hypothetical protein